MGVQLAHPLLKAAGRSSVVMMSSVAGGPTTVKSGTIYAMTKGKQSTLGQLGVMTRACMKMSRRHTVYSVEPPTFCFAAAMDQLSRNLSCEWACDGIRINSIKVRPLSFIALQLAGNVLEIVSWDCCLTWILTHCSFAAVVYKHSAGSACIARPCQVG